MDEILLCRFPTVDIHSIADDLEGIKADAHRKCDLQKRKLKTGNGIEIFQKKICILKIKKKSKAHCHRADTANFCSGSIPVMLQKQPETIAGQNGDRHQQDILWFAPAIEEQAGA